MRDCTRGSHRDALDDVAGDPLLSPVVDLGGLGVSVAGQVLDVLERHVLGEQVGDHQDAEAVGAEDVGQPGIFEPSLEHAPHGVGRQGVPGELLLFSQGRPEQGRLLGVRSDPGRLQVLLEPAIEVVADGDLALLAALFPEPQDALGALVLEGPGVGEGSQEGAVAEADDVGEVDGGEQVPGLLDGELGGLAVHDGVLPPPHGGERVQAHGMADDQGVEEMPQRRQRQILGGVRSGELLNEAPGQPRRNLTQLDSLFFAPGEEAANDAGVGAAGVGVGDAGGEELIGGEQGVLPGAPQDGGSGGGAIQGLERVWSSSSGPCFRAARG